MRRNAMDCSQAHELLEEYFEGTLPEPEARRVAAHVAACARCAAELRQIERVAAALAAAPAVAPAEGLLQRIQTQRAALPTPAERLAVRGGWRHVAVIGAALLAVFAAVQYAAALVIPESESLLRLALDWGRGGIAFVHDWMAAAPQVLTGLWAAVVRLLEVVGLAGTAVAPTLGPYAAAEVGILLAVVLVLKFGRSRRAAQSTLLA